MKKKPIWKLCDYKPENSDYFWRENTDMRVQSGKMEVSQILTVLLNVWGKN